MVGAAAIVVGLLPGMAVAGVKSQAAREAAEYVLKKFSREAAEETVETLASKMERLALQNGDEVFEAARKVGPDALRLVDEAGEHGPQAAKLLGRMGDDAVSIVRDADQWARYLKYGDDAAEAMARHKGLCGPLLDNFQEPAARALKSMNSQSARRLAMMADSGELAKIGRSKELLDTIARFGDKGMDFVWRNKLPLATGVILAAFLADPQPFIDGTRDLTSVVTQEVGKPLAEEVAGSTNWTLVFVGLGVVAAVYIGVKRMARRAFG
jgi:hypothetical protein